MMRPLIVWFALCTSVHAGRWAIVQAPASLPPTADIVWEVASPPEAQSLVSGDGRQVVAWVDKAPLVIVCDWVDWDARKRGRIRTIHRPDDTPPEPTPPNPPNPNPPDPPSPTPPEPEKPGGFAGEVFETARKLSGQRTRIPRVAQAFRLGAVGIGNAQAFHRARTKAEQDAVPSPRYFLATRARDDVMSVLKDATLDQVWDRPLTIWFEKINGAINDLESARAVFDSIATGLEAASK